VVERNPVIIYANLRLNSALTHTDSTGNLRGVWDYDPYGRVSNNLVTSNAVDSDFKFTGHFYHEKSKLHLTLYRAYDADTGRWISRDPIAEAGGINLYGYVANNPVNLWDPLGLDAWYDAAGDWFFERGTGGTKNRSYDSSHQMTRDLMHDTGVQEARAAWDADGRPDSFSYNYGFGVNDYLRELLTLDGTGSFLGSYQVDITKCPDGSTAFDVYNTTGWESATRSPIPSASARRNPSVEDMIDGAPVSPNPRSILNDRPRSAAGPGGNFRQNYNWNGIGVMLRFEIV